MRTSFFSSLDVEDDANKQFRKDLATLVRLDTSVVERFVDIVERIVLEPSRKAAASIVEKLAEETGLSEVDANGLGNVLGFLLRGLASEKAKDDKPEDLLEDMRDLGLIEASDSAKLAGVLSKLKKKAPQARKRIEEKRYATGILPSLRSYGSTVELRGVFEEEFDPSQAVDTYHPKLTGIVPVISMSIGVDAGTPDKFFFQVSLDELQLLIDELRSAQKKAQSLMENVQRRNSS